jgi:hypothetical protein
MTVKKTILAQKPLRYHIYLIGHASSIAGANEMIEPESLSRCYAYLVGQRRQ